MAMRERIGRHSRHYDKAESKSFSQYGTRRLQRWFSLILQEWTVVDELDRSKKNIYKHRHSGISDFCIWAKCGALSLELCFKLVC